MKKYMFIIAFIAMAGLMSSCRNDWTIKDMPPVPEKADGAGYVTGLETEGAAVTIPVEVSAAGSRTIVVRGRATRDGSPGTGSITSGSASAQISFSQAYTWSDCEVTLDFEAGVNDVVISGKDGNGLFQVDYIEVR